MFTLPFILVAGGLSSLSLGAPLLKERSTNTYTVYSGNGDTSAGWPSQSEWFSSFDTMYVSVILNTSLSNANSPSGSIIKTMS